ncbi:MAG: hypothetical protein KAR54_03335 [Candidatus Pacebacteria bacterium]|nr:hypothetical protein [Candidatus Paceibacterota bacterium]
MEYSIEEKLYKIKEVGNSFVDNFFNIIIIILVGFSAFGLGRLSKIEENKTPIAIYNPNLASISIFSQKPLNQQKYVASKTSDKYHAPWCSGAKKIKESNKIWFNSKEEAENAGLSPAANCKGI